MHIKLKGTINEMYYLVIKKSLQYDVFINLNALEEKEIFVVHLNISKT